MTSKMTARVLKYELGSPSYGDIKLVKKLHEEDRLATFKPGLWRTGLLGCGKEWYHFQQELMVNKMIIQLFS